jgi:hypothetical protein
MASVADHLKRESAARLSRLSPGERVRMALQLGDEDAAMLASARGIPVTEARAMLRRQRQFGRYPSRSLGLQP